MLNVHPFIVYIIINLNITIMSKNWDKIFEEYKDLPDEELLEKIDQLRGLRNAAQDVATNYQEQIDKLYILMHNGNKYVNQYITFISKTNGSEVYMYVTNISRLFHSLKLTGISFEKVFDDVDDEIYTVLDNNAEYNIKYDYLDHDINIISKELFLEQYQNCVNKFSKLINNE